MDAAAAVLALLPDPLRESSFDVPAASIGGPSHAHVALTRAPSAESSFVLAVTKHGEPAPFFTLEVPSTTKPQDLAPVIVGALLPCSLAPPAALLDAQAEPGIVMLKAAKQWHGNACGHHALANAIAMLHCTDPEAPLDIYHVWSVAAFALNVLNEYRTASGMWSTSRLEAGTLDATHLSHFVANTPELRDFVTVLANVDELETSCRLALQYSSVVGKRHAFVLGLESHWVAFALIAPNVMWWADAHNKDVVALRSLDDCLVLAMLVVERHRPVFRTKIRSMFPAYEHAPMSVLDTLYDDGIPEWWRGELKSPLWWTHRPAWVRTSIMLRELQAAFAAVQWLFKYVRREPADLLPRRASRWPEGALRTAQNAIAETTTTAALAGFVRRDEDLQPGDEAYDPSAPPTVFTRKRPPPPELPSDPFDRQRVIPLFDQTKVEAQVCLVVGTGGLGQNVALALARMGVGEIVLLDNDTYQASNLTRQCLGTMHDVGKRKVNCAAHGIEAHNIRSKVTAVDCDVLGAWDVVVEHARRCTVLFNCCDAGLLLDFAVSALAKELALPLVQGQSFGWKFLSEFFSPEPAHVCSFCFENTASTFGTHANLCKLAFARLQTAATTKPTAAQLEDFLFSDDAFRVQEPLDVSAMPTAHAVTDADSLLAFLREYQARVESRLLPGAITRQTSLRFIPRPLTPPTRFIGSWIAPCLACGVHMVGHWANWLTGPTARRPPTTILFNLDEGMTAEEQMAYDVGVALDASARSFADSPSARGCAICERAQVLADDAALFFGARDVWLKPVRGGQAIKTPAWSAVPVRPPAVVSDDGLFFPAVPALAPCYNALSTPVTMAEFALPVVKTSAADAARWPGSVKGVRSGMRSAIVMQRGVALRVKGCGNAEEGFPVRGRPPSVRGCMFEDTAARELFVTSVVVDAMAESGLVAGNEPVGLFKYPDDDDDDDGLEWSAGVSKWAVVMRTRGDKRLGAHLIAGLVHVMRHVGVDVQAVERFAAEQARDFDVPSDLAVECGMPVVDFCAWAAACQNQDDELAMVLRLAWRLGWESGAVLKALHGADVCWGTYVDALGMHCNAHANNLVVVHDVDVVAAHNALLAPVDFDMAFTRSQFAPELNAGARNSLFPADDFDALLEFEALSGMRTTLAGSDFASSGVTGWSSLEDAAREERIRRVLVLDTVVCAFDAAMAGAIDAHSVADVGVFRELVCSALHHTSDVVV